ncbi:MAG TPA: type 4 pilus major pilin [Trinickia sp.]
MKPDRRLVKPAALPRSTPHSRRRQRGASLLEGIAYLGIAAIVVIGAIALLRTAFGSANANTMLEQLSSMQTAARKLYMTTQGNYGAVSLDGPIIAAGAVPQGMAVNTANATITNAWGGTVTLTGANTTFTISYENVPKDVCVDALTGTTTGFTQVAVDAAAAVSTPVSPSDAASACKNDTNTIVWTSN